MFFYKQFVYIVFFILLFTSSFHLFTYAQETPTPSPTTATTPDVDKKQQEIKELEKKVTELKTQSNTLSSQIEVMDGQIKLTQLRIAATQLQLDDLNEDIEITEKKIVKLESSLNDLTKVLLNRIVATYQQASLSSLDILLSSGGIPEFFSRLNYLRIVQQHDKQLILETQQAKNDYANQKNILEDKKQKVVALQTQLEGYTKQLDNDKKAKSALLRDTQNDEKKYQDLLARARAEYQAILGIVAGNGAETEIKKVSQGERIASIIPGASCNSSGAHLHFIVSRNGSTENPFNYLKSVEHDNCTGSSCGSGDGDPFNPSGSWEWPISPSIKYYQGYGSTWAVRNSWVGQIYNFHNGIDILSSSSEVKAVQPGTLYRGSYAGSSCRLPYVRVKQDDGLDTFYLHVYN